MLSLTAYRLGEKIYENNNHKIFRAVRKKDDLPVIIKTLAQTYPVYSDIERIEFEYEIMKELDHPNIAKIYDLVEESGTRALIMEDFNAISLKDFEVTIPFNLKRFLKLFIKLVNALQFLHERNLIHRDVKPSNILINPETDELKLTDFSLVKFYSEGMRQEHADILEGTVAYISPEQTGRVNQTFDHRSDFYSLGVTLYEMFCGVKPFVYEDTGEMIHAHIARAPKPPHKIRDKIPQMVSKIILKLLEKDPNSRYQTAAVLKEDLKKCYGDLVEKGEIDSFQPAMLDKIYKITIPDKIFGRKAQKEALNTYVEKCRNGDAQLVLITGAKGTGKYHLANSVLQLSTDDSLFHLEVNYRNIDDSQPYAGLAALFDQFAYQLLTESEVELKKWRKIFRDEASSHMSMLETFSSNLRILFDRHDNLSTFEALQNENRLNAVIHEFFKILADKYQLLTIVFKNIDHIDDDSRKVFSHLLSDSGISHMLLLGTVKDEKNLSKFDKVCDYRHIRMEHMGPEGISEMLNMSCPSSGKQISQLTDLIYKKTSGVSDLSIRLLKEYSKKRAVYYEQNKNSWHYDLRKLENIVIEGRMEEILHEKVVALPEHIKTVLNIAVCVGKTCDLDTLLSVSQYNINNLFKTLWQLHAQGIIFKHTIEQDLSSKIKKSLRIEIVSQYLQQLIYESIDTPAKASIHQKIGNYFITAIAENKKYIFFSAVDHLNKAESLFVTEDDKKYLAEMNYKAAVKSYDQAAFATAFTYTKKALTNCSSSLWETDFSLMRDLYLFYAKISYLSGNIDLFDEIEKEVLPHFTESIDVVALLEQKMHAQTANNNLPDALQTGLEALSLLGINFPQKVSKAKTMLEFVRTRIKLRKETQDSIIHKPECVDEVGAAAIRILMRAGGICYVSRPDLIPMTIMKRLQLSLHYGNNPSSVSAYAGYALMLCGVLGDYDTGLKFGKISLELLHVLDVEEIRSRIMQYVYGAVWHWKHHLNTTIEPLFSGFSASHKNGDFEFGIWCLFTCYAYKFYLGVNLNNVSMEIKQNIVYADSYGQTGTGNFIKVYQQTIDNLQNYSDDPTVLQGVYYNEFEKLPLHYQRHDKTAIHIVANLKLYLCLLFEKYDNVDDLIDIAEKHVSAVTGSFLFTFYYTVRTLIYLCTDRLHEALKLRKKIVVWNQSIPANYEHKLDLIDAEIARIKGNHNACTDLYEKAVENARKNGFIQDCAFALERAGKYHLSNNRKNISAYYIEKAYETYSEWGAHTKLILLKERYAPFLEKKENVIIPSRSSEQTSQSFSLLEDWKTIIKGSRIISGEIEMERLLEKVLYIVMENSGADKVVLGLTQNDTLLIEGYADIAGDMKLLHSESIDRCKTISRHVVSYVMRKGQEVILHDAMESDFYKKDPYIRKHMIRSVFCMPITYKNEQLAVIYLENSSATGVFSMERIQVMEVFASQAAVSIQNALNYRNLQMEIDNHKKTEKRLEENRKKYQELTEMLPIAVYEANTDGNITYINLTGVKMFGYEMEDIRKGMKLVEFVDPSFIPKLKKNIEQIYIKNGNAPNEYMGLKKSGETFPMVAYSNVILSDRLPVGIRGIIIDITDQRMAEKERENIQNQLVQAQKMETVGNLAGGLAHDFNNVLGGIIGAVSLLKFYSENDVLDKEKLGIQIDMVETSSKRAADMVKQLLTLSRKQEMVFMPVNLNTSLSNIKKICENSFDKSIKLEFSLYEHPANVYADPTQIEQVILNLCVNASHAMTIMRDEAEVYGGQLSVTLERIIPAKEQFAVHLEAKGIPYWEISISDTGIGIDNDMIEKIFDPFFTTKGKNRGTGLGLSMVYNIIKQHHGFIHVQSEKGEGSIFQIYLPVLEQAKTSPQGDSVREDIVMGEGTILVIDDEEIIRKIAKEMLESCGYTVVLAASGAQAIEVLKKQKYVIKLALLDISMPVLSGKETLKKLQQIDPDVKAILTSGYKIDGYIKNVIEETGCDFIQKPFALSELAKKVKKNLKL